MIRITIERLDYALYVNVLKTLKVTLVDEHNTILKLFFEYANLLLVTASSYLYHLCTKLILLLKIIPAYLFFCYSVLISRN